MSETEEKEAEGFRRSGGLQPPEEAEGLRTIATDDAEGSRAGSSDPGVPAPDGGEAEASVAGEEEERSRGARWFVLRIQSGREESIRNSLWNRIVTSGLDQVVTELLVPIERVTEMKGKEKRTREQKIFPGYLMAAIRLDPETGEIPDPVWFLIKETPGIGDFVGSQTQPQPMQDHEVEKMLARARSTGDEVPELKIDFQQGDNVRIKEGTFVSYDGVIKEVYPAKGLVKVMLTVFGRPTPVEIEYWKVESI